MMLIEDETSLEMTIIWAVVLLCGRFFLQLIYDTIRSGGSGTSGFEDCMRFFPPELFSGR